MPYATLADLTTRYGEEEIRQRNQTMRDQLRNTNQRKPPVFAELPEDQRAQVQRLWESQGRSFAGLPITLERYYEVLLKQQSSPNAIPLDPAESDPDIAR